MVRVTGTYVCADGPRGRFTLGNLETNEDAFAATINASHPSCGRMSDDMAGFMLD